jgi:2-dehydro-3-deoxygalactonokinase
MSDPGALVCVDAGTSNTRAWLLHGDRVVARREVPVGARDTARDGHNGRLKAAVRDMLNALLGERPDEVPSPGFIAVAGMVTSPQGLLEVPHVAAPAGPAELAAAAVQSTLPQVSYLPFVFIPGVRTAERPGAATAVGAADVMRGEETLCVGLLRQGLLRPGGSLLNLGSHWKLVHIDAEGRVAWSVTSLSGELIEAVRRQTVLASALPEGPLSEPDPAALAEGMEEARRSGLPRALFGVRLLELSGRSTPAARLSFLAGAFIGTDLDGFRATGALGPGAAVTLCGGDKVGGAWAAALAGGGCAVSALSPEQVEAGFLAGCRAVVDKRGAS